MNDDRFFERLRRDAALLRYDPDEHTLARIRSGVRERIESPTVMALLATWFRPLAATFAAIAIAATIGAVALGSTDEGTSLDESSVEITMAGDTYRVAN